MKKSTNSLALQIAQLLEEYSESELEDATELLRKHGYGGALLTYLAEKREILHKPERLASGSTKGKPMHEITSRAVLNLKDKAPEKFRILSQFDSMVRRGQLLPTHEDLRRFGERLSKNFLPKNARKETISSLMAVMADYPVQDIEHLIEFAASFSGAAGTDEYQRLARYLIKGKEDKEKST